MKLHILIQSSKRDSNRGYLQSSSLMVLFQSLNTLRRRILSATKENFNFLYFFVLRCEAFGVLYNYAVVMMPVCTAGLITYLNGEFYSNFLTVSISCISCSFFTTLTSWSFLEQQVQFAVSHSTTASWLQRIQVQAIYARNFA